MNLYQNLLKRRNFLRRGAKSKFAEFAQFFCIFSAAIMKQCFHFSLSLIVVFTLGLYCDLVQLNSVLAGCLGVRRACGHGEYR